MTLSRCTLFTLVENCRLKLNQQELLPFRCPEESSSGEKIVALDSSGKVITFNTIISYFEYWFAESLLLLCKSGTSRKKVKKWKQQLNVLFSDISERPAHLTTTISLAEEDEKLESDDSGSSNLNNNYNQNTYESTYGDTASELQDR